MYDKRYTVLKFGGTSLSTPEKLLRVVELIKKQADRTQTAVVVSAMGKSTDKLIEALNAASSGNRERADQLVNEVGDLACASGAKALKELTDDGTKRQKEITSMVKDLLDPLRQLLFGVSLVRENSAQTMDLILSFGERISARIVATLLIEKGADALPVDSCDWTVTDDNFGDARVQWKESASRIQELMDSWQSRIPVNTGFIGNTRDGRMTTLGRNGSDYTATLLARGLNAR